MTGPMRPIIAEIYANKKKYETPPVFLNIKKRIMLVKILINANG
jgi:hypothetical protein